MTQSNPSAALYPTISQTIGNTPLVRLQRIPGVENERRGNVILGKLEGNNPAGSVKDRPALSMIKHAELRGDIKPGDTLIEATSGNTGIAIAMVWRCWVTKLFWSCRKTKALSVDRVWLHMVQNLF